MESMDAIAKLEEEQRKLREKAKDAPLVKMWERTVEAPVPPTPYDSKWQDIVKSVNAVPVKVEPGIKTTNKQVNYIHHLVNLALKYARQRKWHSVSGFLTTYDGRIPSHRYRASQYIDILLDIKDSKDEALYLKALQSVDFS